MPSRIAPYLLYEDVPGALEFLGNAFGFRELLRYADDRGTVNHAEMELGGESIMMGNPGPDYASPRRDGHVGAQVHVYVDDVDGHFEQARAAGAEILNEPADQPYGDRRYDARDPEGHRWSFAQRIRDVPPEEWGAQSADS
ncbi:MAG TPA: VOC family protein [Gaiellaceae bacterium]|jgi:PhnB protein|nr:VOC family protein [Gaiellaceae bacterium]